MQFLLLIYGVEADWAKRSKEEIESMSKEYFKFTQDLMQDGKYKGGNKLTAVSSASTVRVRNGKRVVTDGPFAETKEQLGGYYLVEAKDLDEALGLAARIPGARIGTIEVRPIDAVAVPAQAGAAKG
jgi:hypothetical protein